MRRPVPQVLELRALGAALALGAILTANAVAEPAAPPAAPPAPGSSATAPAPLSATPAGAAPQADVTVLGRRLHKCEQGDEACVKAVIAEAWSRFPDKVATFCTAQATRLAQQQILMQELLSSRFQADPDRTMPPAIRQLCLSEPAKPKRP